ncbi:MAG TPA: exo-alpha-sialidase [Burkholderiales bacterium]|nr:exo-alpha-sialidase [Burkholderiales bacterium]
MSDRLLVGTRKGLFNVTRRNGRWSLGEPSFLGDPVTAVLHDVRDGTLYASLNLGHFGVKMRRSADGGKTWDEQTAPAYPPQPEGAAGPEWKLVQVWTLETGGRDEPGVLWAGTIPGGLFRSVDHGTTWSLVRPLWDHPQRVEWMGGGYDAAGMHSVAVDPRDSRRLTVAVSTGGVWQTRDRGETWALRADGMRAEYMPPERSRDPLVQDVHRLVASRSNPDVMWVQHHNGVFRSTDGAASWHEIETTALSKFGFAVAVDPNNADTAWFVPAIKDEKRVPVDAKLAVTRTRDGGRTFEVLREGLPKEPAYDLVYRHALDVDNAGERLAMGSTTGGLWISEDRGDSWQCVSAHLPPIAAVRFA